MKKSIFILIVLFFCACGGTSTDNPPNVAGTYVLTDTDCPGLFDPTVVVVQDGTNIIIQATTTGFGDVSGTIDNNGNFTVSNNEDLSCDGQFVSGVAIADCTIDGVDCQITYTRI